MSSEGDTNDCPLKECTERVVTDCVYSRFRSIQIHCSICDVELVGNPAIIERHFDDASHPSIEYCRYCKGKVFRYTLVPLCEIGEPQMFVYHRCRRS